MGPTVAINQVTNKYYDLYREDEITFTKDILHQLRIDPRQIYVKCAGSQWPCIINSTSFQMAKIIIGTGGGCFQQITKKDAPPVNLRYCFIDENNQPIYFFVSCRVTNVTPYMNSQDLAVITLTFTQRPADDLILKLGTMMDANASFKNRKDERILINENSKRGLGINKQESIVYIQNVPRRCILWDVSFSGTKIILMGLPNFLKGKECIIRFLFSEPNEIIDLKGSIVQAEPVEGRRDLCTAGINFDENLVPLAFKIRINNYLSNNKKSFLSAAQANKPGNTDPTQIFVAAKKAQEAKAAAEEAAKKQLEAKKAKSAMMNNEDQKKTDAANAANATNAAPAKNGQAPAQAAEQTTAQPAQAQPQENAAAPAPDASAAPQAAPTAQAAPADQAAAKPAENPEKPSANPPTQAAPEAK